MGFVKGRNKTGGRRKGVANKTTDELRSMIVNLLDDNFDVLQADIASLDPKDRVRALIDLMRFAVPTLKAIEDVDKKKGVDKIVITVSDKPYTKPVFSPSNSDKGSDLSHPR
jgi:hypothetical protein